MRSELYVVPEAHAVMRGGEALAWAVFGGVWTLVGVALVVFGFVRVSFEPSLVNVPSNLESAR
jgi:ABC-type branched-subunit amino acid transport system permease subunit